MHPRHRCELSGRQAVYMLLENCDMTLVRAAQIKSDLSVQLIVAGAGFIRHLFLLTGLARSRNILFVY